MARQRKYRRNSATTRAGDNRPRCGLCGKTGNLTKTNCCQQWICDDTDQYVMFSYARNSCHRNHDRYTLCSFHYNEQHDGSWQECAECRGSFETEIYVWHGTNEYNFEILEDPPAFDPTMCARCNKVVRLGEDGYMLKPGGEYLCERCGNREMAKVFKSG